MKNKIKIIILAILIIVLITMIYITLFRKNSDVNTYKSSLFSFNYSTYYKVTNESDYIELTGENSNITVENRYLNSIENNASFTSIADNIIYEYLNANVGNKLISKYDEYPFSNGSKGYRLIFENKEENYNSLMLINLENLNLTVVIMNATSTNFELLIDSAELIMNSISLNTTAKYIETLTTYPKENLPKYVSRNTKEIPYDKNKTKKYTKIIDNYKLNLNIATNFLVFGDTNDYIKFAEKNVSLTYEIRGNLSFEYDKEDDYNIKPYSDYGYEVKYGYKKYNNGIYYVIWDTYTYFGNTYEEIELKLPINKQYLLIIKVKTKDYKISDDFIDNVLDYKLDVGVKHSEIINGKISGQLTTPNEYHDGYSSLEGKEFTKVSYEIPQKYDINLWLNYNTGRYITYEGTKIYMNIYSNSTHPYLNASTMEKNYANYKFETFNNISVGDNRYVKYVESYQSKIYSSIKHYNEYYELKLSDQYKFWVTFECNSKEECSEKMIKEILNLKISKYKYGE